MEELVAHATLYYLGDLDSGRAARTALPGRAFDEAEAEADETGASRRADG